jgi:flagellar protein FlaG
MSRSINISGSGATTDSNYGPPSPPSPDGGGIGSHAVAPVASEDSNPDPADLRLVIEDDQAAGSFVYKTVDRRTGKVVQQFPREQLLRLREASDYTAGAVIKAKV